MFDDAADMNLHLSQESIAGPAATQHKGTACAVAGQLVLQSVQCILASIDLEWVSARSEFMLLGSAIGSDH
jgi:hypothetical protein